LAQVKGKAGGAKDKWKSAGKKIGMARRASLAFADIDGAKDEPQLSVACVFFTQHTPKFGQHGINPDTGKCWCHNLYGESKCWGCQVSSA
jgi:hypothetical protein